MPGQEVNSGVCLLKLQYAECVMSRLVLLFFKDILSFGRALGSNNLPNIRRLVHSMHNEEVRPFAYMERASAGELSCIRSCPISMKVPG